MHWTPETWTQCLFLILLWQHHRSSWLGSSSSWQSRAGRFSVACKNCACLWRVSPDMRSRRFFVLCSFFAFFLTSLQQLWSDNCTEWRTIILLVCSLLCFYSLLSLYRIWFYPEFGFGMRERGKNN